MTRMKSLVPVFLNRPFSHHMKGGMTMAESILRRQAIEWLEALRGKAQGALDGNGVTPWSPEYILQIVAEIRDTANEGIENLEED